MKQIGGDLTMAAGAVSTCVGVFMFSVPLGLIVAGLVLVAAPVLLAVARQKKEADENQPRDWRIPR